MLCVAAATPPGRHNAAASFVAGCSQPMCPNGVEPPKVPAGQGKLRVPGPPDAALGRPIFAHLFPHLRNRYPEGSGGGVGHVSAAL